MSDANKPPTAGSKGSASAPADLPDFVERLRIRRRAARGRRLLPLAISLGVLAVALVATIVVRFTPLFTVQSVSVSGNSLVTTAQVVDAAAVTQGQPLVSINSADIAARVLTLPAVSAATVQRSWPHTVAITVTERTPIYQRVSQGSYQWVDATGTIFHSDTKPKASLVQVTTPSVDNRLLADVATVVVALPAEVSTLVQKIEANTPDEITVTLRDGRQIIWGSADQSELKGQVAKALLSVKAKVYNVSSPANPTSR